MRFLPLWIFKYIRKEIALGLIPEAVKNILGLELSEEDLDEFVEAAQEVAPEEEK